MKVWHYGTEVLPSSQVEVNLKDGNENDSEYQSAKNNKYHKLYIVMIG